MGWERAGKSPGSAVRPSVWLHSFWDGKSLSGKKCCLVLPLLRTPGLDKLAGAHRRSVSERKRKGLCLPCLPASPK